MTLKISISGVRGLVPESLTPEVCLDFAKAFGSYLEGGKVVVGTDPRASSEFIKGIVLSGLQSCGCPVVDIGICPTPTVGIMVRTLKAAGGLVITASHNPLPWNGLKFMRADGIFLNETQASRLIELYQARSFIKGKPKKPVFDSSAYKVHLNKVLKTINSRAIRRQKFKVAIDCCNGAGSVICLKLLKKLGCRLEAINCDLTKPFPHSPEPVPENLGQLCALVKATKAALGFALDADADRLAIVNELGEPIGEELTLALATRYVLSRHQHLSRSKKLVVTNLSTTQAIDDVAKEFGATVIRTKIGEVHVAEELKALKGLIGGEGNGGVIYPPVGFNRDTLSGITLILALLAQSRQSLAVLLQTIPAYHMVKTKVACRQQEEAELAIAKTKLKFKGRALITTDGVKVLLPEGWVHVRASNTEPIVRIMVETKDRQTAEKLAREVVEAVS